MTNSPISSGPNEANERMKSTDVVRINVNDVPNVSSNVIHRYHPRYLFQVIQLYGTKHIE